MAGRPRPADVVAALRRGVRGRRIAGVPRVPAACPPEGRTRRNHGEQRAGHPEGPHRAVRGHQGGTALVSKLVLCGLKGGQLRTTRWPTSQSLIEVTELLRGPGERANKGVHHQEVSGVHPAPLLVEEAWPVLSVHMTEKAAHEWATCEKEQRGEEHSADSGAEPSGFRLPCPNLHMNSLPWNERTRQGQGTSDSASTPPDW